MQHIDRYILYASLLLQVGALVFAVGMIRRTPIRVPWLLVAAALVVMILARVNMILHTGGWGEPISAQAYDHIVALAALAVSALLCLALFAFRRLAVKEHESSNARGDVERQLASLINNMPSRVFIKDLAGRYVMANQRFVESCGRALGEIIGKRDAELFPQSGPTFDRDDAEVFRTAQPMVRHDTVTTGTTGGKTFHYLTNTFPIFDTAGGLRGLCGISTDVSELKAAQAAAEQSERRLRLALDAASMGIWELKLAAGEVTLSPGAAPMLGLPADAETMAVRQLDQAIARPDRGALQRAIQKAIDTRKPFECEFRTAASAGRDAQYMSIKGHALYGPDGKAERLLGTLTDITARKKLAGELVESQYLNRRVLETTPDLVCVFDLPTSRLAYQNRSIALLLGYDPVPGGDDAALVRQCLHADDREAIAAVFDALAVADETVALPAEVRLRHADGTDHFFALRVTVFARDPAADIKQVLMTAEDITPRRLAEADRDRARSLERARSEQVLAVASASQAAGAAGLSVDEVCALVTERARRIIGAHHAATSTSVGDGAEQSIVAVDVSEKYRGWRPTGDLPVRKPLYAAVCSAARVLRLDADAVSANAARAAEATAGDVPPLRGWLAAPLIGLGGKCLGLIQLSDRYGGDFDAQDEAILVQLAAIAAAAIESARLLNESRRAESEAALANQAKDRFLAVLSHELRTPLSPVLLSISAMEADQTLPESTRTDLAMARRNIELEVRLIDDLLDLSRIRSGKLRIAPHAVSVHALLDLVLGICADDLRARGIRADLAKQAARDVVSGDPARLQQVFWNLVKNAAKFSGRDDRITVRTRQIGEEIEIEVRDNGVGINPDVLPRLFNAFEQGQLKSKQQFGGLGLGLAISKAIVDIHHGTIVAASDGLGSGATFTVRLPLTAVAAAAAPPRPELGPATTPTRLLLVEDHEDTARILTRLLTNAGYGVMTAGGVDEAKRFLAEHAFDVLVSDIGLPDGTGYELMEFVRTDYRLPGIAMSGYGMDEDLARSRAAGFGEHVVKPVEFGQLHAALQRAVDGRTMAAAE
ncbi:MAG TPA: ATP-binding protein [Tepidisphaeraceae bacterium]|jgi:PAS domain S-box-containing protein